MSVDQRQALSYDLDQAHSRKGFWRHLGTQLAWDDFEVEASYRGCQSYSIEFVGPLGKVDNIDLLELSTLELISTVFTG